MDQFINKLLLYGNEQTPELSPWGDSERAIFYKPLK